MRSTSHTGVTLYYCHPHPMYSTASDVSDRLLGLISEKMFCQILFYTWVVGKENIHNQQNVLSQIHNSKNQSIIKWMLVDLPGFLKLQIILLHWIWMTYTILERLMESWKVYLLDHTVSAATTVKRNLWYLFCLANPTSQFEMIVKLTHNIRWHIIFDSNVKPQRLQGTNTQLRNRIHHRQKNNCNQHQSAKSRRKWFFSTYFSF